LSYGRMVFLNGAPTIACPTKLQAKGAERSRKLRAHGISKPLIHSSLLLPKKQQNG